MPLGDSRLRSERLRSPGDLLLDDPEASHAYAWLYRHQPATTEAYVSAVGVNPDQARLAVDRLHAHGLVEEEPDGFAVEPIDETVGDVRVTPGVAAVLAMQLENYDARQFVQRHGARTLARAAAYWPLVREGTVDSRRVGEELAIGEQDGVAAMNFVRGVREHLDEDPRFDEVPTPEISGPVFPS